MQDWSAHVFAHLQRSIQVKQRLLEDDTQLTAIHTLITMAINSLAAQGCLYFCGNGGSHSDALHLTAELTGRFKSDRKAIAAHCLGANGAAVTAIANDFGFDAIFSRELQALGKQKDMLIVLSTSGQSANVIAAVTVAERIQMPVYCLLGKSGGRLRSLCSNTLIVPSDDTAHIQEAHITIGHVLCDAIEQQFTVP